MKSLVYHFSGIILIFVLFISCKKEVSNKLTNTNFHPKSSIKYAKGFDIISTKNEKKLIIKNPYSNTSNNFEYIIKKGIHEHLNVINTPIKKIVVTSTTHIPMLELLGEEKALVGFQNTDYISSTKTRNRIDAGLVKELGNEAALNTESVLELKPDAVIGFTMDNYNKTFNLIEKHGIPVIINGDWREETPLGRAEWIKFFGVLFNKERLADSIFKTIEVDYLAAKYIAKQNTKHPSILSGAIMRNDIWSLPAGESFVAQFLLDANVNYLWKNSKGKGSLQLSYESVIRKGPAC